MSSRLPTSSLWISDVPGHGRVMAVVRSGDRAAVLDDLNGDGREVELRIYDGSTGRWEFLVHHDDVDVPELNGSTICGWSAEERWTVGLSHPGARVEVSEDEEVVVVEADAEGWWLAFLPLDPPDHQALRDLPDHFWTRRPRTRLVR